MPHDSYFQGNPTRLDTSRSLMTARPRWTGTWNIGKLVPIFATSTVMPGDTFSMSIASAIRMVRPVVPVMDDMEITIEAFFVPHRLILSRKSMSPDLNDSQHSWQAFIGAQDSLLNMPTPGDVLLPAMRVIDNSGFQTGGVGDCLGYHKPAGGSGSSYNVNCLKVLAYYSVWNEFFREPSTRNPVTFALSTASWASPMPTCVVYGTDAGIGSGGDDYASSLPLAPVSRYHGYFGSALPWPQRNSAQVEMPLGDSAPVGTLATEHPPLGEDSVSDTGIMLKWRDATAGTAFTGDLHIGAGGTYHGSEAISVTDKAYPTNLYADLSQATAATVNQFRLAVQTQRWYEALARSGNKYSDLIHGMFGVRGPSIPDRPEYLGGFTAPISISQVASTTPSAESSGDLGAVGAFSLSNPSGFLFSKSFTEHGTIMVVACTRVRESFSQGIAREDQKFERFDYYWPQFANLGEQAILKKELYVDGSPGNTTDNAVFGYQEAWAEYRMFNDQVTGYINPTASQSIGAYTYVNLFASAPDLKGYLNAENQQANVDRTLSANGATTGFSLYGQFQFDIKMVRPMPTYSIPGLVDHH